jgi:hypothetical protein
VSEILGSKLGINRKDFIRAVPHNGHESETSGMSR